METRFSTKIDWWLGALLTIAPLAALIPLILLYAAGASAAWVGWFGVVIVGGIYAGLLLPMYYEITADHLLIRHGLVRMRIPYQNIREVIPTQTLLANPALSRDRLQIVTKEGDGVAISPADKAGFLTQLSRHVPQLVLETDRLRPKSD